MVLGQSGQKKPDKTPSQQKKLKLGVVVHACHPKRRALQFRLA
jgi:hypothetical protein